MTRGIAQDGGRQLKKCNPVHVGHTKVEKDDVRQMCDFAFHSAGHIHSHGRDLASYGGHPQVIPVLA